MRRENGSGRLRSKSFISANKGFFALKAKRRSRALGRAKRQRREGTYSLTHFGHLMFFISARGGGYLDWRFKL